MTEKLVRSGVDYSHSRLVELMKLADLNHPFYLWVESIFQSVVNNHDSLSKILMECSESEILTAIRLCYNPGNRFQPIPTLVNGGGQSYPHRKACYYFFGWLVRDAPQQRLAPLIQRTAQAASLTTRDQKLDLEIKILTDLIIFYRPILKNFEWSNIREVLYDRLEGSRRSIRGHAVEIVIRTALAEAIQLYYESNRNYGLYRSVEIPETQIQLGSETFDVSVKLTKSNGDFIYLLVPVKSRETEGGGHSHIFTRDINSAIDASKKDSDNFVAVFIIAQNWAQREQEHVASICDLAIVISSNPNSFEDLPVSSREKFQQFVGNVLAGSIEPKKWDEIRGRIQPT